MIEDEGYPDKSLPQDIARGFALVGHAPSSSGVLPSKIEPATLAVSELEEHAAGLDPLMITAGVRLALQYPSMTK